jgi:hypothetical protein
VASEGTTIACLLEDPPISSGIWLKAKETESVVGVCNLLSPSARGELQPESLREREFVDEAPSSLGH